MLNLTTLFRSTATVANQIILRTAQLLTIASILAVFQPADVHAQTVQWTKYRDGQTAASVKPECGYRSSSRNFAKDSAGNFFAVGGASELGEGAVIYISTALLAR